MRETPEEDFAPCVGAEEAIAQERNHIDRVLGSLSGAPPATEGRSCIALSLSGGGIRSASICMGFIQALAEQRLISKFDYASAVSGGGYALGWWSALVYRTAAKLQPMEGASDQAATLMASAVLAAEERLASNRFRSDDTSALLQDARERQYVRSHGNYLTIKTGLLSIDTWTPLFMIVRNLFFGVVGIGGLAVSSAWILLGFFGEFQKRLLSDGYFNGALLAMAAAMLGVGWLRTCLAVYGLTVSKTKQQSWRLTIALLVVGAMMYSAVLVSPSHAHIINQYLMGSTLSLLVIVDLTFVALLFVEATQQGAAGESAQRLRTMTVPSLFLAALAALGVIYFFGWTSTLMTLADPVATCVRLLGNLLELVASTLMTWADPVATPKANPAGTASILIHTAWLSLVLMHAWQLTRTYGVLTKKWPLDSNRFRLDGDWASYLASTVFLMLFIIALPRAVSSIHSYYDAADAWSKIGVLAFWIVVASCLGNALVTVVEGAQADSAHRELWARWSAQLVLGVLFAGMAALMAGYVLKFAPNGAKVNLPESALNYSLQAGLASLIAFAVALIASTKTQLRLIARVAGSGAVAFFVIAIIFVAAAIGWVPRDEAYWAVRSLVGVSILVLVCGSVAAMPSVSHRLVPKRLGAVAAFALMTAVPALVALTFKNGWIASLLAIVSGLVLCRSGPNTFSMHELYRNRLVRAFLGASNEERAPVKPAGFDANDDPLLKKLVGGAGGKKCAPRPFPIWGAAVNITIAGQVGMQERKAASFSFSPLYCGLHVPAIEVSSDDARSRFRSDRAYAPTESHSAQFSLTSKEYEREDLTLGTVVATSGAAFSSNSGSSTTPERALLLTLLGFRLGRWFPNPARCLNREADAPKCGPANPWVAGIPLHISDEAFANVERWRKWAKPLIVREALSQCDITSEAVYVTDGGHFENLGVYEMVRRKIALIVCIDAGCDPKYAFSDLLNLQSKVRADFGVEIDLNDLESMATGEGDRLAKCCLKEFRIIYTRNARGEPFEVGTLIYCKSTLTGDEPKDVHQYRAKVPSFPHVSTVNQWFAESAFEAYRVLGLHIGRKAGERLSAIVDCSQRRRAALS